MPERPSATPSQANRTRWVAAVVVALAVAVVYGLGLHNGLFFDDARLSDGSIFGVYGDLLRLQPRMLSYGSFVWLQSLLGDGFAGQRGFNILLHLGVCAALFLMLRELLATLPANAEPDDIDPRTRWNTAALVACGLFALNPVAAYAVAYLIQRSIVMATLFSLLAIFAFVRGLRRARAGWLIAAALAYLLALASKEHAIGVVALSVPIYAFVSRPGWKKLALTLVVVLAFAGVLAWQLDQRYGGLIGAGAFDSTTAAYVKQLELLQPGISERMYPLSVLNEAWLFFRYGALWVFPNVLWMSIDLRPPFPLSWAALPQLAGLIGFVALGFGCLWLIRKRQDALGLAALFVLCAQLLFATEFATTWAQDPFVLYRSYLWSPMLAGLLALLLLGMKPKVMYGLGLVLGIAFGLLTAERVLSMRDEYTAWSDAVDKIQLDAPPNAVGRWRPYINRGAYFLAREAPQSALEDFDAAVRLGEPMGSAQMNRGVALQMLGQPAQALAALDAAEAAGFKEAPLYYHRAVNLARSGRFKEAFDSYTQALSKPQTPEAKAQTRLERAEIAIPAQQYAAAIADFKALLQKDPTSQRLLVGQGIALVGSRKIDEALATFDRALQQGESAPALYGKALAMNALGNRASAQALLDRAIQLDPRNPSFQQLQRQLQTTRP